MEESFGDGGEMQSHADTLESTCEAMAEPSAVDPHDRVVSDYEARLDAELVVLRSMRVALAATQHMLEAMRDDLVLRGQGLDRLAGASRHCRTAVAALHQHNNDTVVQRQNQRPRSGNVTIGR